MNMHETMEQVMVKTVRNAVQIAISDYQLHGLAAADVASFADHQSRHLVMRLVAKLLGDSDTKEAQVGADCVYVPDGWWQAVRERWAPQWWLRRWPVRQRRIVVKYVERHEHVRVCPHIGVQGHQLHVMFLLGRTPQACDWCRQEYPESYLREIDVDNAKLCPMCRMKKLPQPKG